jgi:beta-xylosidase
MLVDGGRHYLFTSQNRVTFNIPVRSGVNVGQWGPVTDALADLPTWAQPGDTWAPDVRRFGSHYVLYFTAALAGVDPDVQCIGDAYSTQPAGPYIPGATPFICQRDQGGSIDPRTFVDSDGALYMLWKSDNNSNPRYGTTNIYSQQLSADGMHLLGQPTRIFGPDEPWQGTIVEAPDLVLVRGTYYLFYSGNWFNQPGYAIGVATCAGPSGPCADTSPAPLLGSNAQGAGPGEESVFTDSNGVWLLYTPFRSNLPLPGPPRPVAMARLGFGPGGPYLAAPTTVSTGN